MRLLDATVIVGFLDADVLFVPGAELVKYEDRKAWLVNGTHLDVAIRGRAANQPDLRLVVNDPKHLAKVQETIEVLSAALERRHHMEIPSSWTLDRLRVVCQLPDGADRVLGGLLRANPVCFLRAFEERIAVPARVLVGA